MREFPGAAADHIRLLRRRAAPAAAVTVLVVVAIAAAVLPWSTGKSTAAEPRPLAAATRSMEAGLASPDASTARPIPSDSPTPTPPAETATPEPTPSLCVPAPYVSCDAPAAPTPLPSTDPKAGPFELHVPILEYHRVKPLETETGYSVSLVVPPDLFAAQMNALYAAGWQTMTMAKLGDFLRLGLTPPARTFVATFDDGYADGFLYAFPILHKDGFVGTFFVIASRIGNPDMLNIDQLQQMSADGDEIGNHSMSHEDMAYMPADRLVTETFGASALIARAVGEWPQSFSYPIGLTSPAVISALSKCPGIQTAVIQGGSKPETWANRFVLPRIRVGPGSVPQDLVERMNRYLP
ncbi:MAG: polysaccharide deacetylase family protein [Candidatus Limnocylindrales bacterium]